VENSPVASGYSIACAQYNGFLGQPQHTRKGVYKLTWSPSLRKLQLDWANHEINCNGVMIYSAESGLLYGSGREDSGMYHYYGIDWNTGRVAIRQRLGDERKWDDAGCSNIIGEGRSITFSGLKGLVQIRVKE
jgi:hypothetical protein